MASIIWLEYHMVRMCQRLSVATCHLRQESFLKHLKIDVVGVTISFVNVLCSEICFPLNWLLVSSNFHTWGHPYWNKWVPLLHDNPISLYTSEDRAVSPESAPVYMCQVPLTIFIGTWFPGPFLLWSVSFGYTIGGEALLQWAVGWSTMIQAFSDQCKVNVNLNTLTFKGRPPSWGPHPACCFLTVYHL